jgi:RNA polymerase sigma-B factor
MQPRPSHAAGEEESVGALLAAYAADHDPQLRERIILACLQLADRLALRYRHTGASLDDLRQTARTGLVAAVDRYQPQRGTSFVAFAVATVVGELKRSLRDTAWRLHVPRPVKEHVIQLRRAADQLCGALGRSPTVGELAGHLGLSEDEVLTAMEAERTWSAVSLDAPAAPAGQAGQAGAAALGELVPAAAPGYELEDLILLPGLVAALPAAEREAVVLYFFGGLTQYEIAERISHSQMHVSRLLRRALTKLRRELSGPDTEDESLGEDRAKLGGG